MAERHEFTNIIRVADGPDKISKYLLATLSAMSPQRYKHEQGIKIQVMTKYLATAEYLIRLFKNAGLYEIDRKIKVLTGFNKDSGEEYKLPDAFEIILKKIPALMH